MCFGCWEEFGKPAINDPLIHKAAVKISNVFTYSLTGGNLHIVIGDWNIDDESLESCVKFINEDKESSDEKKRAEYDCLEVLKKLTEEGRASALAIVEGYLT